MAPLPRGIRKHTSRQGFEVRVTAMDPQTGESRRFSAYAKTLPEAKSLLRDMKDRSRIALLPKDSNTTLANWAEMWCSEFLPLKDLASSTKELYFGLAKSHLLNSELGKLKMSHLTAQKIEKYLVVELGEGSASLKRNVYAVLSHLMKDAVRNGVIARSPLADVSRPKANKKESRFISQGDLESLLNELESNRYLNVFQFILQTGLRRGEVLALSWQDVDMANSFINVRASLDSKMRRGAVKTAKSQRTLDLNPSAIQILKKQKIRQLEETLLGGNGVRGQDGWDPVFTNEKGAPICPRALLRVLQRASTKANLNQSGGSASIGIHTLRHFVASKLLTAGVDMLTVSRILGHDSIQTTVDIYGHIEDKSRKLALSLLA